MPCTTWAASPLPHPETWDPVTGSLFPMFTFARGGARNLLEEANYLVPTGGDVGCWCWLLVCVCVCASLLISASHRVAAVSKGGNQWIGRGTADGEVHFLDTGTAETAEVDGNGN